MIVVSPVLPSHILRMSDLARLISAKVAAALFAALLAASTLPSSTAFAGEMIVTGLAGLPRANGVSLLMHDRLSERSEPIELETNRISSLSVLYGSSIALQLGPSTKVMVSPATDQRGELIELVRGELRTVSRRDRSKKRPEIHTPSSIIRPSTSTLHVFVDSISSDTDVTSLENRAWVVSNDPIHKQSAILNTGQQLTVHLGSPPGNISKSRMDVDADITGFLSGSKLREAALSYDMKREGQLALSQIALNDVPNTELPSVASPFPTPAEFLFQPLQIMRPSVCSNTYMCSKERKIPLDAIPGPPVCTGIPGEQCQR
ncbi:MAG: hypothetical protein ACI8W3_002779 [Myxococcota bacterium]|jgi:hypothetical protein